MRRVMWIGASVGAAFWSVLALTAYGVFDLFGGAAAGLGTTPGFPVEPFSWPWFASFLHRAGLGAVLFVWLAGLAVVFGAAYTIERLVFARRRRREVFAGRPPQVGRSESWGSSFPPDRDWSGRRRR